MVIFSAYAYKLDISTCQAYVTSEPERIAELEESYKKIYNNCSKWCEGTRKSFDDLNLTFSS